MQASGLRFSHLSRLESPEELASMPEADGLRVTILLSDSLLNIFKVCAYFHYLIFTTFIRILRT
ncbi:unnamed protein product [Protopolystoma xenopodis]|uniref:Uncharacterized protein n=1 Tax=Protopolystoma xenopodis TaxID=117903 RepID=A0A3S5AYZ9_9PLAT|nr:unnamed protein product [Protopolystoma xenopodis]